MTIVVIADRSSHSYDDSSIKSCEDEIKAKYATERNVMVLGVHMQRQSDQELVGFVRVAPCEVSNSEGGCGVSANTQLKEITIGCVAKMDEKSGQSFWSCGE
jgi:molybdopterin biosynthesis enzyme MoaB